MLKESSFWTVAAAFFVIIIFKLYRLSRTELHWKRFLPQRTEPPKEQQLPPATWTHGFSLIPGAMLTALC